MQEVFNFFMSNWQVITSVLSLVLAFILLLIKKKPVYDVVSWIYKYCLYAVKKVEKSGIVGADNKKNAAIDIVNSMLMYLFPNIRNGSYNSLICKSIEEILETPQKKGE